MRALSAADLLDAWERALDGNPTERMLVLLRAACPEFGEDELVAMPVGSRDGLLLELRALLFGPDLTAVAPCPACGELLESAFPIEDIQIRADPPTSDLQQEKLEGLEVAFRLPSSSDLLALEGLDAASARDRLLARCVVDARDLDGAPVGWDGLPESVVRAVCEGISAADPQADLELGLTCPSCGHAWAAPFDIASFLWAEIHAWVQRLLRDVHYLARAYGWREPDVLALSPIRRSLYLELSRQ